jgi:hypothetical protein
MTDARDAGLAVLALGVVLVVAVLTDARLDWRPLAAGSWGAVVLELLLLWRPALARRLWRRRTVRAAAVLAVAVAAWVGRRLLGPWVLAFLAGGLGTYLVMLGAVAVRDRRRGGAE